MRYVAERAPSRYSREQALERRVLALERQVGNSMNPLDAQAAQQRVR
jgi:hypothetical protein